MYDASHEVPGPIDDDDLASILEAVGVRGVHSRAGRRLGHRHFEEVRDHVVGWRAGTRMVIEAGNWVDGQTP